MMLLLLLKHWLLGRDSLPMLFSFSVISEKVRMSTSRFVMTVMEQLLVPHGDHAPPLLGNNRMSHLRGS